MSIRTPEILAPVGTWQMCVAAVQSGADAIYVGMPHFNARGRTEDLSITDLHDIIAYCHLSGVKVYLAFNILIFEEEFQTIVDLLQQILPLGVDALIVQDIGLVRLIKELAPTQVVHASTQMTISSEQHLELISELGMARYVLARELSIPEIAKIREKTDVPLEVFVHGALCVSYSGQCLTSESQGGRSANRGQCAQSCRLSYEMLVDGKKIDLKEKKYLVSPKDLCALDDVSRLQELKVDSFKIEGRLKSPEYVATTVKAYKEATLGKESSEKTKADLKIAYSRDFFNGWMDGVNHQKLVRGDYSNNQGLELGKVIDIRGTEIILSSRHDISPGDGVSFFNFSNSKATGAFVYSFKRLNEREVAISLDNDFDLKKISKENSVFLNHSRRLEKQIQAELSDKKKMQRVKLDACLTIENEKDLILELITADKTSASAKLEGVVSKAKNKAVTEDFLKNAISALSSTPFYLNNLEFKIPKDIYIQEKSLRQLKQQAISNLFKQILSAKPKVNLDPKKASEFLNSKKNRSSSGTNKTKLSVLLREQNQTEALHGLEIDTVYLDFEHGKDHDQALLDLRSKGFRVGIATTRILKPAELGHLKKIERLKPDCILIRNLGALNYFKDRNIELIGDFSLNAANSLTANWLMEKGLSKITPSYDLNKEQLFSMLENFPAEDCEVTAHHYMPEFHMEHCVFAAFLSNGSSWRDCGRPCEKHRVELVDVQGKIHPLKADGECRNTMFNGTAQSAIKILPDLQRLGVRNFRLEALFEEPNVLRQKIIAYLDLLNGKNLEQEILKTFKITEKYGVTDGQLLSIGRYNDRKKASSEKPALVSSLLSRAFSE